MMRLSLAALLALLPLACTAQTSRPATASSARQPAPIASAPESPGAPAPSEAAAPAPTRVTYNSCNVDGPYIAMTYDDGPHATNTPRLLDMLKQRGIKATFFVVGECVAEYPAIMKRIVAEGHEVASHSWSHPNLSSMSDEGVKAQLQRTHDAIISATGGVAPRTMRPPYGAFTERQKKWCHAEFGYKCILWDVDPNDWKYRNAARVHSSIMQGTRPGSIILTHDIHKTTIDAMPQTLDDLTAKGFKFVTVSELLAMDRPKAKATPKPAAPVTPAEPTAPTAPPAAPSTPPAPEATAAPAPASPAAASPAGAATGVR